MNTINNDNSINDNNNDALRAIEAWQPLDLPSVAPPALADLVGDLRSEPWLDRWARELGASPSVLHRAASAGLVARLWSPLDRGDLDRALGAAREDGPAIRARAWWAQLPDSTRQAIVRLAVAAADQLADEISDVRTAVVQDPEGATAVALDWLHRRDDLACLAALVRGTSDAAVLDDALRELDREASIHHSMWSLLPEFDDDRLCAVATSEPEAWWGDLAALTPVDNKEIIDDWVYAVRMPATRNGVILFSGRPGGHFWFGADGDYRAVIDVTHDWGIVLYKDDTTLVRLAEAWPTDAPESMAVLLVLHKTPKVIGVWMELKLHGSGKEVPLVPRSRTDRKWLGVFVARGPLRLELPSGKFVDFTIL